MKHLNEDGYFDFTDAEWDEIAGTAELPLESRSALEHRIGDWLRSRSPVETRAVVEKHDRVVRAALRLLKVMQETETDFHIDDDTMLSDILENVTGEWWDFRELITDDARSPLQFELGFFWHSHLRRELTSSWDPINEIAGGPVVRFFVVTTRIVTGQDLSPNQARYAARSLRSKLGVPMSAEEVEAERIAGLEALESLAAMAKREK